jgi:1,6-anhydro-N-acetylmuramate kinase
MCGSVLDSVIDGVMITVNSNAERFELLESMRTAVADVQHRTLLERSGLQQEHENQLQREKERERQVAQLQIGHMQNLLECHIIFESRV